MNGGELREMSVAEILSEAFRLYRENFAALVLLALAPHLVLLGLDLLLAGGGLEPQPALIVLLAATVVLNALVLAAVTHGIAGAVTGHMPAVGEAYRRAYGRGLFSVVAAYLVIWVLVTLGILAFVLPGLIIGGILLPTVPIIVLERQGAAAALVRAYRMMQGSVMKGTAVFAFVMAVTGLLPLFVHILVGPGPFSPLLGAILGSVTLPLAYSATVVLYLSLRGAEGYTLAALATDIGAPPGPPAGPQSPS